jgi:hypothetical protein
VKEVVIGPGGGEGGGGRGDWPAYMILKLRQIGNQGVHLRWFHSLVGLIPPLQILIWI